MTKRRIFVLAAAAALTLGWYLFRPERLWVDSVVAESLEEVAGAGAGDAATPMPIAVLQGSFRGVQHEGAGTATVYRRHDGVHFLRLTEFETSNGPDLYVYLVASTDAPDDETVERAGHVSLGRLKGNRGEQNYVVPSEVDLSRYRAVSIWCRRFSVNFAAARLEAVLPNASGGPP